MTGGFQKEDWRYVSRAFQGVLLLTGVALVWLAIAGGPAVSSGASFSVLMIAAAYGVFRWVSSAGASARVRAGTMVILILFDLNGFESLLKNRPEVDRAGNNELDRLLSLRGVGEFFHWGHDPVRAEAAAGVPDLGHGFHVEIDDSQTPVSGDLRNIRYRVTPVSAGEPGAIYWDPYWKIYENPGAYPRAWMVHQVVYERSRESQLARLKSPGFDPRQTAALDGGANVQPAAADQPDWVTWHSAAGGRLEMEVDAKRAGVLVLSQRFSQGWSATVDGGSVPLMRADGELQAIALPSGNHQVVVKFRPWLFYLGAMLSLAGLLGPAFLERRFRPDLRSGVGSLDAARTAACERPPSALHQRSFNPNCTCRADVAVAVITPAVGETPVGVNTIAFGALKFARFRMLKSSARNCRLARSPKRNSLRNDKSHVASPGPASVSRPRFP